MSKYGIILVAAVLVLSSMACGLSGIKINNNIAEVTVDLQEDQLNKWFQSDNIEVDSDDEFLDKITAVDLHDGYITIKGTYRDSNGSEATGSYDVALSAEDGELMAEIISIDIDGLDLQDSRVQRVNRSLARELAQAAAENRDEVKFKEVSLTEESAKFVLSFRLENR